MMEGVHVECLFDREGSFIGERLAENSKNFQECLKNYFVFLIFHLSNFLIALLMRAG